eukprot:2944639-Rhodomonas_salina.2
MPRSGRQRPHEARICTLLHRTVAACACIFFSSAPRSFKRSRIRDSEASVSTTVIPSNMCAGNGMPQTGVCAGKMEYHPLTTLSACDRVQFMAAVVCEPGQAADMRQSVSTTSGGQGRMVSLMQLTVSPAKRAL